MTWTLIHRSLEPRTQHHISRTVLKKIFFIGRIILCVFAYNRFSMTRYVQNHSRHHQQKANVDRPKHGISGMGMVALLPIFKFFHRTIMSPHT